MKRLLFVLVAVMTAAGQIGAAEAKAKRAKAGGNASVGEPSVYKRAVVTIAPGQSIEFFEGV